MNLVDALQDSDETRSRTARVNGVVSALVTDNKDPEGKHRVKLSFPWLAEHAGSDWAKVTSFMTGKGRGGVFLPEVGDEVLVGFEHGDINHPYVLGSMWNSEDAPPVSNTDGKNNVRSITSRSGHQITLDDSSGSENIEIKDKSGNNRILIDTSSNQISIQSQQTILIKSQQIKIEAQSVQITADSQLTLKSSGTIDISGTQVNINQG